MVSHKQLVQCHHWQHHTAQAASSLSSLSSSSSLPSWWRASCGTGGGWELGRWLVRTSIKLSAGGASATQSAVSSTLQHSLQCTLGNIVKIVNNRCCRVLFELHNRTMHYAVLQSIAENIFICDGKQVGWGCFIEGEVHTLNILHTLLSSTIKWTECEKLGEADSGKQGVGGTA